MKILQNRVSWLIFVGPALAYYGVIVLFPILQSLWLSLFSWNGITPAKFAGLANYREMLGDRFFWEAVRHNLVYVVVVVATQILGGLLLALILLNLRRGQNLVKTLFYVPVIIVTVAIAQMFRMIYSLQPEGLINVVLSFLGLGGFTDAWLSNPHTALFAVSLPEGWRFTGLYMIIFHAALMAIPSELEDAARIEGVNELQLNWYIRLPFIRNILLLATVMATTGALRGFDIPYIINAPSGYTEIVTTYMYDKAFSSLQYGYGSAISIFIIFECVVFVLMLGVLRKLWTRRASL
ncbi:carbohydrate ABC transporter permease [Martelella mediterranea]|uniref:Raffinose/stachyose/melibiose transport system permease protein n=1 Tax=Martelella mediterranea TaxID=293089 RepID=A0A4R3NH52_9HYPH|nr:sugar ABC transporter permease [Martelella mediterranea]TCT33062.1 raffinose/stachyose/melibiose transport system permease protein [Martelella mediterranea]